MEESKVILIVEDDEALGKTIEHGLHHLVGDEQGIPLRTLRAKEPIGAVEHIKSNDVDLIVLDVNLENGANGINFAKEVKKYYPYIKIIILTRESGDAYKVRVHEEIRYDRFFTKPIEWDKFSAEVAFQLKAPMTPKKKFLPTIDASSDLYRTTRESFFYLRKVKNKRKVDIFTNSGNPKLPDHVEASISKYGSFEKFLAYMIPPEEKELLQCEEVTIVNANKIIRICKTKHFLILDGCAEEIYIAPVFRPKIYAMFTD